MLNCGTCGHPGVHAEVIPEGATWTRCPTQCAKCKAEIAAEQAANGDQPKA